MGHLYPGMLDVATDLTTVSTTFGSHVEVLEFDDLRERVNEVTEAEKVPTARLARDLFVLDESVNDDGFAWGPKYPSASTGSCRTSIATPSPITTADLPANSTSGSVPG